MRQTNWDVFPNVPVPAPIPAPAGPSTKPWYASVGVWGALVTLGGSVLTLLNVQLDRQVLDDARQWLLSFVTLVGGGVALWGRIRATARIGKPATGNPRPPTLPPPTDTLRVRLVLGGLLAACAVGGASSISGCAALAPSESPYLTADRATYDAVAPEYRAYVSADTNLTAEQRDRRARTLETWRLRVEDEERHSVTATP